MDLSHYKLHGGGAETAQVTKNPIKNFERKFLAGIEVELA